MPQSPLPSRSTRALLDNAAWVQRLARSLISDAHLADDIAQEALTVALERQPAFAGDAGRLRRWLTGVTRHLAARAVRREAGRRAVESRVVRDKANDAPSDAAERLQLHRRLTDAVLALDEPYRSTLVLRFFDNLAPSEIAAREGIPPATVRKRLSRGLARLRENLDRKFGGERGAWCAALAELVRTDGAESSTSIRPEVALMSSKKIAVFLLAAAGLSAWIVSQNLEFGLVSPGEQQGVADVTVELEPASVARGLDESDPATREAIDALPSLPGVFVVQVIAAERKAPLADAHVLVLTTEGELLLSQTDAKGQASLEALDGPLVLAVAAHGHVPAVRHDVQPEGHLEVSVGLGRSINGRILVDGAPPAKPLELYLEAARWSLVNGLPAELEEVLLSVLPVMQGAVLETDREGHFSIEGVPSGWQGRLYAPENYLLLGSTPECVTDTVNAVILPGPVDYLELRLTRMPTVSGQVTWADTGNPVDRANLSVLVKWGGEDWWHGGGGNTLPDGRFEVGVSPQENSVIGASISAIQVSVHDVLDGLPTRRVFDGDDLSPAGSVGVITMERGQLLHFVVRDQAGTPIEGALAFPIQRGVVPSTYTMGETGHDGAGVLRGVAQDTSALHAGARGFAVQRFEVGTQRGTADAPLVFTLKPTNTLEVRVLDPDGRRPQGVRVRIDHEGALFLGEDDGGPTAVHEWLLRPRGGRDRATFFFIDADGRVELFGLRPQISLQISAVDSSERMLNAVDSSERVLVSQAVIGPGAHERASCTLVVETEPTSVRGRVVDVEGAPIAFAEAEIRGDGLLVWEETDASGEFHLLGNHASGLEATLEVTAPGYAGRRLEGLRLSPNPATLEIVLERGLEVTVSVEDLDGRAVAVTELEAVAVGRPVVYGEETGGQLVLSGLSPGRVRLEVRAGGRIYERWLDSSTHHLTWVLPTHGKLIVEIPLQVEAGEAYEKRLLRVTAVDDADVVNLRLISGEVEHVEFVLLPGDYRIELVGIEASADGERVFVPLEAPMEVSVGASSEHSVSFVD